MDHAKSQQDVPSGGNSDDWKTVSRNRSSRKLKSTGQAGSREQPNRSFANESRHPKPQLKTEKHHASDRSLVASPGRTEIPAEQQWRERRPPSEVLSFPRQGVLTSRMIKRIVDKYRVYIDLQTQDTSDANVLEIWGDRANARSARSELENLMARSAKPDAAFAKLNSMTMAQRESSERKWLAEVKRHYYRRRPPLGYEAPVTATFQWPVEEFPVEDTLGGSGHPALDPIREDNSCYIIFDPMNKAFQIFGEKSKAVGYALQHGICSAVQSNPGPTDIVLTKYQGILSSGVSVCGVGASCDLDLVDSLEVDAAYDARVMHNGLMKALDRLPYFRGHLSMQFHLGTLVLKQYRDVESGICPITVFADELRQPQFKALVTKESVKSTFNHEDFCTLKKSSEMLLSPAFSALSLADTRPSYSAVFVFIHEDTELRLHVECTELNNDANAATHLQQSVMWTREDKNCGPDYNLVDISITDVETSRAWQCELISSLAVDEGRLPADLITFQESVKVDKALLNEFNHLVKPDFLSFNKVPKLKSVCQTNTYSYNIKDTEYVLDLALSREVAFQGADTSQTAGVAVPVWIVKVRCPQWREHFAHNKKLAIGEEAPWRKNVANWFPKNAGTEEESQRDGFGQFLDTLWNIDKLVNS